MNKLDARTHEGKLIGQVIFDDVSDAFSFEYDKNWISSSSSYPISPSIPFIEKNSPQSRNLAIRRYFENLLPEGVALDTVAQMGNLSKSNLFGLLRLIGRESSGAIVLLPHGENIEEKSSAPRFISKIEISERINNRDSIPYESKEKTARLK